MHRDTRSHNLLKKLDPVLSACADCDLFWTEIFFESLKKFHSSASCIQSKCANYTSLSKIMAIKDCQKAAKSIILPVKDSRQQS